MKNSVSRVRWMIVMMLVFAWKFQGLEMTTKRGDPVTQRKIAEMKKLNAIIKCGKIEKKKNQVGKQTKEITDPFARLSLIQY